MVISLCLIRLSPWICVHLRQWQVVLRAMVVRNPDQPCPHWRVRGHTVAGLAGQSGDTSVRRTEETSHRGSGISSMM